jgi:hypothetical protein
VRYAATCCIFVSDFLEIHTTKEFTTEFLTKSTVCCPRTWGFFLSKVSVCWHVRPSIKYVRAGGKDLEKHLAYMYLNYFGRVVMENPFNIFTFAELIEYLRRHENCRKTHTTSNKSDFTVSL